MNKKTTHWAIGIFALAIVVVLLVAYVPPVPDFDSAKKARSEKKPSTWEKTVRIHANGTFGFKTRDVIITRRGVRKVWADIQWGKNSADMTVFRNGKKLCVDPAGSATSFACLFGYWGTESMEFVAGDEPVAFTITVTGR